MMGWKRSINLIDLSLHFNTILNAVGNAKRGLTKPVFLFISQLTPMVNVDLLIVNKQKKILMTWRADEFYGPGWHLPGGVIRFKESAQMRINAVAKSELGAEVTATHDPISIQEIMAPNRDVRGHFISLLYRCELKSTLDTSNAYISDNLLKNGQWKWHDACPDNLINQHQVYRPLIEAEYA